MISAGFGCKKGCEAGDVITVLEHALVAAGFMLDDVDALYAPDFKSAELGLHEAAQKLGKELRFVGQDALLAQEGKLLTRSSHSLEHTGVSCVCEAAALADGNRRLLGPRVTFGGATCALAMEDV